MKHWLWISLFVLALDQASKWLILSTLQPYETLALAPHVNLTLAFNPGAAFSFLATAGGWQRWFFAGLALVVTAVLVGWLLRLGRGERLHALSLALLIGGAVGNLIDRVLLGHVIDFIQVSIPAIPLAIFNPWPAFNVADSAITVGVLLLIGVTLAADEGRRRSPS